MAAKLLVVDDDDMVLMQLKSSLSDLADVATASSGATALELIDSHKPDLIFLDIYLPDNDGFTIMKGLRNNPAYCHIPVIIMTANAIRENYAQAIKYGAVAFLSKPLDSTIIHELVTRQLNNQSKQAFDIADIQNEFNYIISMLSEAVIITDHEGVIESVNQYCLNLFGYEKNELLGQNIEIFTPPSPNSPQDNFYSNTVDTHSTGKYRQLEAITKSGKKLIVEINLSEYISSSSRRYIGIMRDLTKKLETENKLIKSVMTDGLTGLASLSAFRIDNENISLLEQQNGYILAFMLDVDEFQKFNAVYGHEIGDKILKAIANILHTMAIQENLAAYRITGDRFIICSWLDTEQSAANTKMNLIKVLDNLIGMMKRDLELPVSITTVCVAAPISDTKEHSILEHLELALKSARAQGSLGSIVRASNLNFNLNMQSALLALRLKSHIDQSKLSIVLQPKVNKFSEITSYEALLRWTDSEFDALNLFDFIHTAEKTGAIINIGHFVLQETCKFLVEVPVNQRKIVFINLSIRQLSEQLFLKRVINTCKAYGINHCHIGFELTETMICGDIAVIRTQLNEIKQAGFEIAVDDFGTGQSNLRYIHRLPITCLKIDKSFIDDIVDVDKKYPLVDTIIAMARALDLSIVAEGVETKQQADYLLARDIDEIQGFYYYKPMSPSECLKLEQVKNTSQIVS